MRLKITFFSNNHNNHLLPINYNYFLSSAVYFYLSKADKIYSSKLHKLNSYKFFTFSWLQIPKKQIEGGYIKILSEKFFWYVSSPSKDFISTLANGILKTDFLKINDAEFELSQIEVLPEAKLSEKTKFICLSPIVVTTKKEHNGKLGKYYYKPTDDTKEIIEKIKNNLVKKYEKFYNKKPKSDIKLEFDKNYLPKSQVLVHYIKGDLDIKIPAIMCPFFAEGDEELVKFGYECGFGELNSAGFGMVKVNNESV